MHILGLAKIAPGQVCDGNLTPWDRQESLLWSIYDFADDCFSGQILEAAACGVPCRLVAHMYALGARPGNVSLCQVSSRVAHSVFSDNYFHAGSAVTGFDLAAAWGCDNPLTCKCIMVPVQLIHGILEAHYFHRWMLCARATRKIGRLFPDLPSGSFFKGLV